MLLKEDSVSAISSQSSDDSSYSTASSASEAIERILSIPVKQQVSEILGEVPLDEPLTQPDFGSQPMDDYPNISGIDGGRKRKSRHNTKSRKSRKGRKGRKGRMTKKGRKHHKTLKRYRSKMRR